MDIPFCYSSVEDFGMLSVPWSTKNNNSLKTQIIVKKGGPRREFWENSHDKDTIKMIHEDLKSSPEAAEWSHQRMAEGRWAVAAAPCTRICTFPGARAHG